MTTDADPLPVAQRMGQGIGYRLMTGMGWTEGKGLGREESGALSYVRVRKKADMAGACSACWPCVLNVSNTARCGERGLG